ncbi:MAG: hypothetical protein IT247_04800 [Bacteroidia bacterium]|nr:hypothetical protein [Bacteroidia bacterium]
MDGFNSLLADKNALTLLYEDKLYLIKSEQQTQKLPDDDKGHKMEPGISSPDSHKGIVFIYRGDEELDQSEQQLFSDMITKGLKLPLNEVMLLRIPLADAVTFEKLKEKYQAFKMILFGMSADDLGLTQLIPKYKVTQVDGLCKLLAADSLEKIARDLNIKKQFWASLQEMFK